MFGARHPIILAPMGGVGTPELAAAVTNAGGLGSLACAYLSPARIESDVAKLRSLTAGPFAVNLFVYRPAPLDHDPRAALSLLSTYHQELGIGPPALPASPAQSYEGQVAAVVAARPAVFSFTFGIPDASILDAFRAASTKIVGTATTLREALALEAAGVDAVVAQGAEAGAHRGTFLGSFEEAMVPTAELTRQAAEAVSLPVIASGGIRHGREVAAMLGLGASAVQIGTAFIPCPESGAAPAYKRALLEGVGPGDTVVTRAFSGRPARGLPNRFIRELEATEGAILPFPWQNAATRPLRDAAARAGRAEFLSLWAGEGPSLLRQLPAAELVEQLVIEAAG